VGEITGYGSGVVEFSAVVPGQIDPQRGPDALCVYRDADQALLRPEAEGVPDEAEQIWGDLMVSDSTSMLVDLFSA
jgi:hypothetical protein